MLTYTSIQRPVFQLAFLLLFPGFFLYHTAIGAGIMPAVLGGYFSPVGALLLPVLASFYARDVVRGGRFMTLMDYAFWSFLAYFFFVAALNVASGAERAVFRHHLISMFHYTVVYLVFRQADFTSDGFRRVALAFLLAMSAIVLAMSVDGIFYLKQLGDAEDSDSVATYQGFARSYFITLLVVVPFLRSLPLRIILYLLAGVTLYLNTARSELAALPLALIVIETARARNRAAILLALLIAALLLMLFLDPLAAMLPQTRSKELLDPSSSNSWEMRQFLFSHALSTISANPLLGDYGSYYALFGNAGSFAHNIVSAWVDLGLAGFLYLVCLLLLPMYFLLREVVRRRAQERPEELQLAFCLLCVTLLFVLTSKSFTYMVIAAALGRYAHYTCRSHHAQGSSSDQRSRAQRYPHLHQAVHKPGLARL